MLSFGQSCPGSDLSFDEEDSFCIREQDDPFFDSIEDDIEQDPMIHSVTDEDLYSDRVTLIIGEKAQRKLNDIYELFSELRHSAVSITKSQLEDAFYELVHLVGSRSDACFVADLSPMADENAKEIIGLIHSPLSHVIPPLTTWYALILEGNSFNTNKIDIVLSKLTESQEMLTKSLISLKHVD